MSVSTLQLADSMGVDEMQLKVSTHAPMKLVALLCTASGVHELLTACIRVATCTCTCRSAMLREA